MRAPHRENLERLLASGDVKDHERLFEALFPILIRCALRAGMAYQDAQDLAQECSLLIWRHRAQFDARRGCLISWALGILHNRYYSLLRSEVHNRRRQINYGRTVPQRDGEPPDALAEREQRRSLVRRAVEQLPAEQGACLKLWLDGRTWREIAQETGKPHGTCASLGQRAKARCRDILLAKQRAGAL